MHSTGSLLPLYAAIEQYYMEASVWLPVKSEAPSGTI